MPVSSGFPSVAWIRCVHSSDAAIILARTVGCGFSQLLLGMFAILNHLPEHLSLFLPF